MDDKKKEFSAQDGQSDAAVQHNGSFPQQGQVYPGGWGQFGGFPGGWGGWPYGESSGGMYGAAPDGMHMMGHGTPEDGAHSWKMPEADSLMGLLMQSNNRLFEYLYTSKDVEDAAFSGLTDDERAKLKEILNKLLVSWNKQGHKDF